MRISSRGQITIPQRIRRRFGLQPFTEVEFVEEGERLILQKRAPKVYPIDRSIGVLTGRNRSTDRIIEELRGR